jgi:predicted dehydrogenase
MERKPVSTGSRNPEDPRMRRADAQLQSDVPSPALEELAGFGTGIVGDHGPHFIDPVFWVLDSRKH